MKKILLLMVFAALAVSAGAQGIQRQRAELARPGANGRARVEVTEEADAARAVTTADRVTRKEKVTGYRVSLFRDNSQAAGENARSVAAQFREQFPEIPVQVAYQSPYFTVTAGNFVDKVDAIALCGKALAHFPKAVVMQEEIAVKDIVAQQKAAGKENFSEEIED